MNYYKVFLFKIEKKELLVNLSQKIVLKTIVLFKNIKVY